VARSQEERRTNDAIEAAIEAYRIAYRDANPEATHGTMTDWIVIAAETKPDMDDPEDDVTAYSIIMPGGGIPWYRARGLLEAGIRYLAMPDKEEHDD